MEASIPKAPVTAFTACSTETSSLVVSEDVPPKVPPCVAGIGGVGGDPKMNVSIVLITWPTSCCTAVLALPMPAAPAPGRSGRFVTACPHDPNCETAADTLA